MCSCTYVRICVNIAVDDDVDDFVVTCVNPARHVSNMNFCPLRL